MAHHKITLGTVVAAGAALRFHCEGCGHSAVLPMGPVVARHGDAVRLDQIERVARCTKCGSRRIECRPEYPKVNGQGTF